MTINAHKLTALTNWLTSGAPPQIDFEATVAEFGGMLTKAGIPVDTLSISGIALNPLVLGKMLKWSPGGGARRQNFTHEEMNSDNFVGSLIHTSHVTKRMHRFLLGETPQFDRHGGSADMARRGYVELVAVPLIAMHGIHGTMQVGTKRAGGFTDEEISALRSLAAPLARVVGPQIQHENTETLLATYLGAEAGSRILHGKILRGEAEVIPAVILFADFIGFTALSNRVPPAEVIETLNRFFDAIETPIRENGGEILKFMGDGVLAIFPTPDDVTAQTAAAGALSALDDARAALAKAEEIDFRASLHVGDIHYGNIGSANRLDFTAIGPAVNLAARMLGAATEKGAATVCSAEFAALAPGRATPLGAFDFEGFDAPAEVHAID